MKIIFSIITCVLLANLFVTVNAQSPEEPKYGGTLIVATGTETPTLNPALYDRIGHPGKIFNGLIRHDQNLVPHPDLAESWEISKDSKTYTFYLVQNATFHDGMYVTSADVKFSIEQAVIPYHPLGKVMWKQLESIETPDKYTVTFNLKEPVSDLLFRLDLGPGGPPILPKHLYEGTEIVNNPYNQKPIGSGPFKFVRWDKGSQLILEKNENYFRSGLPYLDRIIIRTMPDSTSVALALENGEVNYVPAGISLSDVKRLRQLENIEVTFAGKEGNGETLSLVANLDHPIIGNKLVRKAIAHAIDKDLMVNRIYLGALDPALSPVSSTVSWAFNNNVQRYDYDLEKANQLLDEAGYPKDKDGKRFSVELHNIAGRPDRLKVTEIVREQLREVGIDASIISLEISAYDDIVIRNRDFDLALEGWSSGPDPAIELAQLFHSKQVGVFLGNGANYKNERVDQLLDDAAKESDRQKKAQLLYEVQDHLAEDLPFIPLVEQNLPSAYTDDFVGLPSNPWIPTELLDEVWWKGANAESSDSKSIGDNSSNEFEFGNDIAYILTIVVSAIIIIIVYSIYHHKKSIMVESDVK